MDKMCSIFSIQQEDEFLLETPSFSITYSDCKTPQTPTIFDHASLISSLQGEGTTLNSDKKGKSKQLRSYDKCPKDGLQKRMFHRDIERLRRQEMGNLYDSLRSFIPQEQLKGKRSVSDHILEASNYIRDLQNNIKELRNKRDSLKNQENLETRNCSKTIPINVTVKTCTIGVEVSITGDFALEGFPLSSLLQMLVEEGLNVISCTCTRVDGTTSHYTIQSEVIDFPGVNLDMLQRKLRYTVNHWISFGYGVV